MCNEHYARAQAAKIMKQMGVRPERGSNMPWLPHFFPDRPAPVVRQADGERSLDVMRWGFPPLKPGMPVVTNVRNTASPFWKGWLKNPAYRCLVPSTEFCEWTATPPKQRKWFALSEDRPLYAFAGIWRPWTGTRGTKKEPVEGEHLLFSFLTTEPNAVVRPVHAKAMPVILRSETEWNIWLTAPVDEALALQQPLPDDALVIVSAPEGQGAA